MKTDRTLFRASSALLLGSLLLFVAPARAQQSSSDHHPHWSYTGEWGPDRWGDLEPAYATCKTGKRQSPIDIENAKPAALPPIRFEYQVSPLRIINNGHTIQVNYEPGSTMTVGGKQYSLLQFHFHHPSEEKIGGKQYDLVAHLVHKDAEGHLAVVAILFESGQPNPFLDLLWKNVPKEIDKEVVRKKINLNAADLLPADRDYYTFAGSLTTPPCSEGVTWYVLKNPVELSPAEIATFAKWYPDNARPIQPTNGREILESKP
ncbi:MAG TPA: carbonic anhydrase family protein [Verrucomicrobiae bacterium]|nr:carbonic anhydrase family protein [Verrucomicrobiae bacterium]